MDHTHSTTIGQYIMQRRMSLNMRQEDLAKKLAKLGVHRSASTISVWESDASDVPFELWEPLSLALEEPSPAAFYELAGVLDKIPGGEIVKLLRNASQEDIDRVERMIKAFLKENE